MLFLHLAVLSTTVMPEGMDGGLHCTCRALDATHFDDAHLNFGLVHWRLRCRVASNCEEIARLL